MGKYPKHESRLAFLRHRREGTHEAPRHLYRDNAKAHERHEFEKRYGKKHGDYVYGAVVGKVYRERYGHPYEGGRHPVGNEGHQHAGCIACRAGIKHFHSG